MNEAALFVTTVSLGVLVAVALIFCLRAVTRRDFVPLAAIVGGGVLTSLSETLWDTLYHLTFGVDDQWTLYVAFGIRLPYWATLGHIWYYGALAYLFSWLARERGRMGMLLFAALLWVVAEAGDFLANAVHLAGYGVYHPTMINGSPVWTALPNVAVTVIAGVVIFHLRNRRLRPNLFAFCLVSPMSFGAVWFGATLPAAFALNLDHPSKVWLWLAVLFSTFNCLFAITVAVRTIPARNAPAAQDTHAHQSRQN
jgi:hypothetical protein